MVLLEPQLEGEDSNKLKMFKMKLKTAKRFVWPGWEPASAKLGAGCLAVSAKRSEYLLLWLDHLPQSQSSSKVCGNDF